MRLLDRINRTGTTVIMATHDDEIVNEMRKRVVELSTGSVVRDEATGVYGERESILPQIGSTPVLDAPGRGQPQVRPAVDVATVAPAAPRVRVMPEPADIEAERAADRAAARAAEHEAGDVDEARTAAPAAADPHQPPASADDVVQEVLREHARIRAGREA
jgi:cell division transport system ATP-binding protein